MGVFEDRFIHVGAEQLEIRVECWSLSQLELWAVVSCLDVDTRDRPLQEQHVFEPLGFNSNYVFF